MTPTPPTSNGAPISRDDARRLAAEILAKRKGAGAPGVPAPSGRIGGFWKRRSPPPPAPPSAPPPPAVPVAPAAAEAATLEAFASGDGARQASNAAAPAGPDTRAVPSSPRVTPSSSPAPGRRSFSWWHRRKKKAAPSPGDARPERKDSFGIFQKQERKRQSGLHQLVSALSHVGMGKERMLFIENAAMMLKAGLPLIDTLRTLQAETRVKPMRKLLQRVLDSVENGSPLWRALDDQGFFSMHTIALVRIGEEAGNLSENMTYLARQEEKDHELKSKVKMAMLYPSIVLVIMFVFIIILGMFVLPNLIGVLYSLNVPLPLVTRIVIHFSNFFTQHGVIAVPGSIAGFLLIIILAKFTPLKIPLQWVMFKLPGIGALARQATIARFGVILGGLLQAGVPVIEAMQSLVEVTPIMGYRRLYQKMLDHISVGDSFSKSFDAIRGSRKFLPPSVQQLVVTGERSGSLAEIMLKIADIYDKKASETAQKLPVILEPILLIFIGALVATIAFSIIVPIYSIVGSVGG
jgi:type IV pilus assembly protein PilC